MLKYKPKVNPKMMLKKKRKLSWKSFSKTQVQNESKFRFNKRTKLN